MAARRASEGHLAIARRPLLALRAAIQKPDLIQARIVRLDPDAQHFIHCLPGNLFDTRFPK